MFMDKIAKLAATRYQLYRLIPASICALMLLSPISAKAQWMDGNALFAHCTDKANTYRQAICQGYIQGVMDGGVPATSILLVRMFLKRDIAKEEFAALWEEQKVICMTADSTTSKVRDIVINHLFDTQASRHNQAGLLVTEALLDAFPCEDPDAETPEMLEEEVIEEIEGEGKKLGRTDN